MRSLVSLLLFSAWAAAAPVNFSVVGDDPGPWPAILSSIGLQPGAPASVFVLRRGAAADPDAWKQRVEQGAIVVVEGDSPVAAALGFRPSTARVEVRSVTDSRAPSLEIVWQHALTLNRYDCPADARIFVRERWTGAPLAAGLGRAVQALPFFTFAVRRGKAPVLAALARHIHTCAFVHLRTFEAPVFI